MVHFQGVKDFAVVGYGRTSHWLEEALESSKPGVGTVSRMKNLTISELESDSDFCGTNYFPFWINFVDDGGALWKWQGNQTIQPYTLGPRNELIPGEAICGCFDSSGEWGQDLVVHPEYICLLISPTDADSNRDYLRCVRRGSGEVFERLLKSRWYRLLSGLYGETIVTYTIGANKRKGKLYAFTGFNLQPVWSLPTW